MFYYAAGIISPLLVLVQLWHRTEIRNSARGRTFSLAGRTFHTTSLLTGALLIAVGIIFIATNGLVSLPELVSLETQSAWQSGAQGLGTTAQIAAVLGLAAIALVLWWWWPREQTSSVTQHSPHSRDRKSTRLNSS